MVIHIPKKTFYTRYQICSCAINTDVDKLAFIGCCVLQCINLFLLPPDRVPQQLLVLSLLLIQLTQQSETQTQCITQQKLMPLEIHSVRGLIVSFYSLEIQRDKLNKQNLTTNKTFECYPMVSSRRSLSLLVRGQLVLRMRSTGQFGLPVVGISFTGVCCESSGATVWSVTEVSGPVHCSSGLLSSISNEDCSWSFSSEMQRGE